MNIERFTQFPEQRQGETPLGLWERISPSIPNPRTETYISTPLTSGPAKRYISKENPDLSSQEVTLRALQANTKFIETISVYLHAGEKGTSTIPSAVGKRDGWGELDYSKFWLYYISGVSGEKAREFDKHVIDSGIQENIFNDHSMDFNARLGEYKNLVNVYGEFAGNDINPVSLVRLMPGYEESLGCTMEKMLAEKLDIPTEFVVFDANNHEYQEKIEAKAPWLKDHPQTYASESGNLVFFSSSV